MNEASNFDTRAALLARARSFEPSEPGFARFLGAVAEAMDPEDFRGRSVEEVEDLLRLSYGRLGKRELQNHNVYVIPPDRPDEPEIIEVFSADTPFIVDSVLAAIRAHGGIVRALFHPTLLFDPATYRVLDEATPGSRLESFLHVDLAP